MPAAPDADAIAALPACQNPVNRTCDFYYDCLEKAQPCGSDGYAVSFGGHYCNAFKDGVSTFDTKGQYWIWEVMHCLQVSLIPMLTNKTATCDSIRTFGFNSHPACYLTYGKYSICDLDPLVDGVALIKILGIKTILEVDVLRNELAVGVGCLKELLTKAIEAVLLGA
ncbi:hypothetical protein DFJ73DRAFT_812734 [Zopfochytrium polystomum]|nr:hypothetical protein DFJ73DRAFT_812734 [Zopfochytrium polystomum]